FTCFIPGHRVYYALHGVLCPYENRLIFSDSSSFADRLYPSGILPCFLGGFSSRLFWNTCKALIRRGRVSRGSIISSIYPRAAATCVLANFSRYSAASCFLSAAESAASFSSRR